MESKIAVQSLSALGHERRLEVFRLLVNAEPLGLKPAAMLEKLNRSEDAAKLPASSLSSHLSILKDARLITSERISREILYRANMEHVQALVLFLVADCCGG
ncbi:MAG: transcriptional regulator, partial [Alphaproteobacteria bacterium]